MNKTDAFTHGQIRSKLWLCRELEKLNCSSNLTWIYGGWYGLVAFLLLSRNKFNVKRIHSYDVDPSCKAIAEMINDNWVCQSEVFRAHTLDCNLLLPTESDLIINTATEHFPSMTWWNNIPSGKRVVLQGNNMVHEGEEVTISTSLDNFKQQFPLSKYEYTGEIEFNYDTWGFKRYMVIGIK
jgi:hypothetical protein